MIINGGKAMYLVEALAPYFVRARSVQVYSTKMVGRTIELGGPRSAEKRDDLTVHTYGACTIEDLLLEFDNLVVGCGSDRKCDAYACPVHLYCAVQ